MIRLVVLCLVVTSALHVCTASEYGNSGSNNYKPPITYAGPIVYSDEKPPIISFPGPPSHGGGASNYNKGSSYGGGGSYGYAGDSKGPNSITYVPLPLDDLPILIYQSKDKPPIHVMNRPSKDNYASQSQQSGYAANYGAGAGSASGYGSYGGQSSTSGYGNYGSPSSYAPPSSSYAAPPSPKPVYVPKPSTPSAVYLPSVKPQYSGGGGGSYGAAGSYGSSSNSYGMGYGGGGSYSSGGTYGGGSMSYNNVGNSYGSGGGPSGAYNPPAPPPPPHIVYSGHPPIHVYQQPNVYNQPSYGGNAQQTSYGGGGSGYGNSGGYGGGGGGYGYKPSGYAQQQPSSYGGKPQSQNYVSKPSYNPPKQTYVPAPVGYHKPPIIIYQGVRPPVHVYSEPSLASGYGGYGASYESGGGAAPGYGGYSAKNGNEWEPLKPQEGAAPSQGNAAKTFGEKMDQDVTEEEQQQLATETENEFNTAEPEQEQVSQQVN